TNFFRNPERSFNSLNDFLTNTPEFVIFIFILPFIAGLIVGFIRKYASDSRWHGPPDVILAAHSEKNPLDIKSGFLTSFSSILSISAGGSVGQYGPLVHFGATIGFGLLELFPSDFIPAKYHGQQLQICERLGIVPSSCVNLATTIKPEYEYLRRGNSWSRLNVAQDFCIDTPGVIH
ncbi:MAG: chloride channel protein, partial [Proteobacteria bacterium]|nr:chloride channel protein [Pseudomonadota bacterium]